MNNKTIRKGKSAQFWSITYKNRIVGATWLMLLIGIFTAAKPFLAGVSGIVAIPGLSSPEVLSAVVGKQSGILLSAIFALVLIIPSLISMAGKGKMLLMGVIMLAMDVLLILYGFFTESLYFGDEFQSIMALAVRILSLGILYRGYRAVALRAVLLEEMGEADRKYEEEIQTGVKAVENEDPDIDVDTETEVPKPAKKKSTVGDGMPGEKRKSRPAYRPKPESKNANAKRFAVIASAVVILFVVGSIVSGDLGGMLKNTGLGGFGKFSLSDLFNKFKSVDNLKGYDDGEGDREGTYEDSFKDYLKNVEMKLNGSEGTFAPGRVFKINAQGLGYYDAEKCRVTIGGKQAQIYSWADNMIMVQAPSELAGGEHEILVTGSAGSKTLKQSFNAPEVVVSAEGYLRKGEDNVIQGGSYRLMVPSSSVLNEQKIVIKHLINSGRESDGMSETIFEYEVSGEDGSHVEFKEPVILSINLGIIDFKARGLQGGNQLTAYTYDDWQGRWFPQEVLYDEKNNLLHIKTDHFSPGAVVAPKKDNKMIEGKYCKAYYNSNEKATGVNVPNPAFADSRAAAVAIVKTFDRSYEAYVKVMGKDNSPNMEISKKKWNESTWSNYFTALALKQDTVTEDNRAILNVTKKADGKGAYQRSITGTMVLPVSYDKVEEMENMVGHELFHIFQAQHYGNMKKLISAGKQKSIADWTLSKLGFSNSIINSGFIMDATAEYAASAIARGKKVDLSFYDDTKIGKPYYQFEQKNSNSQEYGMAAFIQYIIDKNVFKNGGTKEASFKRFWLEFVKNAGYSSNILPALDKLVSDMTGHPNTQKAYENFWAAVLTDEDAASFSINNGVGLYKYPIDGSSLKLRALAGGYSANSFTFQPKEYQKKLPETKIQSFWFIRPKDPNIFSDIYKLEGDTQNNRRIPKGLEGVPKFDYLSNNKTGLDKPLTYDAAKAIAESKSFVVRIFTSHSGLKSFDLSINVLASNVVWANESELLKYYGSNYTLRTAKEFRFKLEGFHEQYKGEQALRAEIDWGDGGGIEMVDKVEANSEIKIKHEYSPDDVTGKLPKITIVIKDAANNVLHKYEKGVSPITLSFVPSSYNGKVSEDVSFVVSGLRHPKNYKIVWNFGDGQKAESKGGNMSHSYIKAGNYKVTAELYDLDSKDNTPVVRAAAAVTITEEQKPAVPAPTEPVKAPAPSGGYYRFKEKITTSQADLDKQIADLAPWGLECTISVSGNSAKTYKKHKNTGGAEIQHWYEEPPLTIAPGKTLKLGMKAQLVRMDPSAVVLANTNMEIFFNNNAKDSFIVGASIDNLGGGNLNTSQSEYTFSDELPGNQKTLHIRFTFENDIYYSAEYVYEWVN